MFRSRSGVGVYSAKAGAVSESKISDSVHLWCLFCLVRQKNCWSYEVILPVAEHDWLQWSHDKFGTHVLLNWLWHV